MDTVTVLTVDDDGDARLETISRHDLFKRLADDYYGEDVKVHESAKGDIMEAGPGLYVFNGPPVIL